MRKSIIALTLVTASIPVSTGYIDIPFISKKDFRCLVDNIYHEARGESFKGQVLVAKTTLARANHNQYPDSICEVVYQPRQFSWTINGNKKVTDFGAWGTAAQAAWAALQDNGPAPLFFHSVQVKPKWAKTRTVLVKEGNHIFYE